MHARRIISSGEKLILSPYSLIEINLGARAESNDISGFMIELTKMVEGYQGISPKSLIGE